MVFNSLILSRFLIESLNTSSVSFISKFNNSGSSFDASSNLLFELDNIILENKDKYGHDIEYNLTNVQINIPKKDEKQKWQNSRDGRHFWARGYYCETVGNVNEETIKKYIRATRLPFFIKGALSAQDALRCRDLGAAGLVLSHHNGLMRYAVPPVMILPEIRKAVGHDLILIADGGIESGFDAFKALARGADAVTVGKALMGHAKGETVEAKVPSGILKFKILDISL